MCSKTKAGSHREPALDVTGKPSNYAESRESGSPFCRWCTPKHSKRAPKTPRDYADFYPGSPIRNRVPEESKLQLHLGAMTNSVASAAARLKWMERKYGAGSPEHLDAHLDFVEASLAQRITEAVRAEPRLPVERRRRLARQVQSWTTEATEPEAPAPHYVGFEFRPGRREVGTVTRRTATTLRADFGARGEHKFTLRKDGSYRPVPRRKNSGPSLEFLLDPDGLL